MVSYQVSVVRRKHRLRSWIAAPGSTNRIARKGHEIVAKLFFRKNIFVSLITVVSVILFFVRVNQVLVRLWARASGYVFAWFRWLVA